MNSTQVFSGVRVAQSLIVCVMFCISLFVSLFLFFWLLCCLPFLELQIFITPQAVLRLDKIVLHILLYGSEIRGIATFV